MFSPQTSSNPKALEMKSNRKKNQFIATTTPKKIEKGETWKSEVNKYIYINNIFLYFFVIIYYGLFHHKIG
jgi:hypothetical protein